MATYETRPKAFTARRQVARKGVYSSVVHCAACDQYHIVVKDDQLLERKYYRVLRLLALGYTRREAAEELGQNVDHVEYVLRIWFRRLNALNVPHLIAIASALGIIDPREFVPGVTEATHIFKPRDRRPWSANGRKR